MKRPARQPTNSPTIVTSRQNPLIQFVRSLRLKKRRDELERFFCEGERVVDELLKSDWTVEHLLLSPDAREGESLARRAAARGAQAIRIDQSLDDYIADTEHSQGIFAVARASRCGLPSLTSAHPSLLILDHIADPGNVGTIIRTARAFGCDAVVLLGQCADPLNPKTIRASAGSLFHVPVVETANSDEVVAWMTGNRLRLFVATAKGGTAPWKADLSGRIAIAMGHETRGISKELARAAQGTLTIPLSEHAESLNVAAAAAAILGECLRQRLVGNC